MSSDRGSHGLGNDVTYRNSRLKRGFSVIITSSTCLRQTASPASGEARVRLEPVSLTPSLTSKVRRSERLALRRPDHNSYFPRAQQVATSISHDKSERSAAGQRAAGTRGRRLSWPGGTSRRSLSLTWDVSRTGVGFSRGECKHSVKRCPRGHGTAGHGFQGGTCVLTRGPRTAGGEWGHAGLASSPRPRPHASHAAAPPHASRPAGCGRKKHGVMLQKRHKSQHKGQSSLRRTLQWTAVVMHSQDARRPETDKHQFHPCHGCLNPLLPFVC